MTSLNLVDSPPETDFDNLTRLVQEVLNVPVALVSIVEPRNDRQYFKSQQGLPEPWATLRQTPLSHSFCQHVTRCDEMLVIDNALENELVCDNLAVRDLGVSAYLGMPIYSPDRICVGALCAIDVHPREWTATDIRLMNSIADCVTEAILLRAAFQTAAELHEEQKTFTYALSHDLKAPVVSLKTLLRELHADCSAAGDASEIELLDLSMNLVSRMESQIGGLSEFHRLAGSHFPLAPVKLERVVFDALVSLKEPIHECRAEISIGSLPDVQGIESLLISLFQNLIENAIKYRRKDRRPSVRIEASVCGKQVQVRVIDNGIGIPFESHGQVFEMFERLHSRADYEGTGLGLAICKRIVDIHRGTIEIESGLDQGTTVIIRLQGLSH
ncbi:ATP-binding protein [Aporhodopirellula aestuarii]|uniref:histidine kinase n=1 Tax=Aporhodopirellula aestuarii TaxID=2950107 RepID=A0ABT0U6R3_9BACT|nr:ATP-binding protein [Aporhodopirellula aestuarii]MCM2372588.1 ATP-binding protein [Aporhodopirellula aestuarii]